MRGMPKSPRIIATIVGGSLLLLDSPAPEIGLSLGSVKAATQPLPFDLQGHRGARGLRPENTLPAFAHALSLGVVTLEMDTAVTKDGVVVVSHDPELNPDVVRDPDGKYVTPGTSIHSLSFAELQRYDVGRLRAGSMYALRYPEQQPVDGTRFPRLAEVFALAKRSGNAAVRFNVETKIFPPRPALTLEPDAFAAALVAVIREAGMASRTTVQSFDWRTLKVVQKIAPEIETVALTSQQGGDDTIRKGQAGPSPWLAGLDVDDFGGSVPRVVKASGVPVWSPNYNDLTEAAVQEAHALGLRVVPWTANDPADIARIVDWKVDGLISDYPDRLRAVLIQKGIAVPKPTPVR